MVKQIQSYIKLQIPAGSANPSPPIGPALGQKGVNIIDFCKAFNLNTETMEKGMLLPVIITVYSDRSFSFVIKTPPAAVLLKKAVGISLGSSKPSVISVGKISRAKIYDISRIKESDMSGSDISAISRSIIGTARSMGLDVVEDE